MKLVVIYGPPAAGKLTVAKELAKLTGYKVFHNHLTLDAVESALPSKSADFWNLVGEFRIRILQAAAKEKIQGVVFTCGYDSKGGLAFFKKLLRAMKKEKGNVCLVQLYAPLSVLKKRVTSATRKQFNKMRNPRALEKGLAMYDSYTPYPHRKSLRIDNTKLSAKKVAKMIQQHYKL